MLFFSEEEVLLHGTTMTAVQILTAALWISALISVRGLSNITCLDICQSLKRLSKLSLALIYVRGLSNITCPDICQKLV